MIACSNCKVNKAAKYYLFKIDAVKIINLFAVCYLCSSRYYKNCPEISEEKFNKYKILI